MADSNSKDNKKDTASLKQENNPQEDCSESKVSETTAEQNLLTVNGNAMLFIPARDEVFVGRDEIFSAIDDIKSERVKILYGLPGVGKTSIAKEYAYRKLHGGTIDKIYWFDADAEYKVNDRLYKYGTQHPDFKFEDGRLETIKRFLDSIHDSNRIMLIFDNVEQFEDVKKPLDINLLKCKIIITTKNGLIKPTYAKRIEISPFGINDMKAYIQQTLPNFDIEQVNKLIEKLEVKKEYLPYKLSMISTIFINDPKTDVDKLLDSPDYGKTNKYLIRILERLNQLEPQAEELLKYLVVLDPDNIPRQLIERIMKETELKTVINAVSNQNLCKVNAANTSLYGLRMHRLLQDDLEKYFTSNGVNYEEIRNQLEVIINELFPLPKQNPDKTWTESSLYYPNAIKIINAKENKSNELLQKIGVYNGYVLNNYNKAIEYLEKALNQNDRNENSINDPTLYNKIGYFYSSLGKTTEALEYYKKASGIRERLFKEDHPDKATSYNNIGTVYSSLGDTTKALEYYTKALDMHERSFERDHLDIATSFNNIGTEYSSLGKTTEALENNMKALDIRERLLKEDHPDKATSYNNIGMEYSSSGDTTKALEYYTKALDMQQRLFKEDHPDKAKSYNNIGMQYSSLGVSTKALEYYTKALDMQQRLFKEDHPDIALSHNNIGGVYSSLSDTTKALEYFTRASDIRERLFERDHPDKATSYNNIGMEYSSLDDTTKALEYYKKALDMRERLFNGNHPDIATSYNNIGTVYSSLGKTTEALEYYMKAIDMQKRFSKGDHPDIATFYYNIGTEYSSLGKTTKALEYYMKAKDMKERSFKEDHSSIALLYDNIGSIYSKLGDTNKALEYYMKAKDMQERLFKGGYPDIAIS